MLWKADIFPVIGLALIAASVAIAIFLPSKENVMVAAGGMAQFDMITDDPSGANLSMVLLAYVNLNCALLLILMAFIFPRVAKFKKLAVVGLALIAGIAIFLTGSSEEMILRRMPRKSRNSEEMILRSMISTVHMRSVKQENEE